MRRTCSIYARHSTILFCCLNGLRAANGPSMPGHRLRGSPSTGELDWSSVPDELKPDDVIQMEKPILRTSGRVVRVFRLYPILAGLLFLGLGTLTLIRPEILGYYSIDVANDKARIAIRAMIGGGELALGLVIAAGQRIGISVKQRSLIAACVFLCVGLVRLAAAWMEGGLGVAQQPYREAAIELILGSLGLVAAMVVDERCALSRSWDRQCHIENLSPRSVGQVSNTKAAIQLTPPKSDV